MKSKNISIVIEPTHSAYLWAKKQSDSVSAFGHIGTHIDCYDKAPALGAYEVGTVVVDCRQGMPELDTISHLDLAEKALVLYTDNLEKNGYGTDGYGQCDTSLQETILEEILLKKPAFIVIDSYGIGAHGEQHIRFDMKCESKGCFVIENVHLTSGVSMTIERLRITIDQTSASTGKRCEVDAFYI